MNWQKSTRNIYLLEYFNFQIGEYTYLLLKLSLILEILLNFVLHSLKNYV